MNTSTTQTMTPSNENSGANISVWTGLAIGFAMTAFNMIPWSIVFIFTRRYGLRYYTINNTDECRRVQRRVKGHSSHTSDNDKGYGYAFGKWYITHVGQDHRGDHEVWMIATEASFKELTRDLNDDVEEEEEGESAMGNTVVSTDTEAVKAPKKKIDVYDRRGSYDNLWYRKRTIRNLGAKPHPEQRVILDQIKAVYEQKQRGVFYIHGAPCTGKSMIGLLLAEEYGASYSNSYSPWEPGDILTTVIDEAEPTKERPLVLAFEEVDGAIIRIHEGIERHKNIPTAITDKSSWNRFLDNFDRGLYPFVILLMTSNKSFDFINSLDSSYLRKGRVDEVFEMGVKME
jgi:hypothetical protein